MMYVYRINVRLTTKTLIITDRIHIPRNINFLSIYFSQLILNFQIAESERLKAERILEETKELISETRQRLKQDAQEVKTRFQQRVGDIAFWKSELDLKLAELKEAIEEVECQRDRVSHALAGTRTRWVWLHSRVFLWKVGYRLNS